MVIAWQRYCWFLLLAVMISCLCDPSCAADQQISKKNSSLAPEKYPFIPSGQSPGGSVKNSPVALNDAKEYTFKIVHPLVGNDPGYVPGQVIVRYKPAGTVAVESGLDLSSRLNAEAGAVNATPLTWMGVPNAELVHLPEGADVESAIEFYEKNPAVLYAQPNYVYPFLSIPDDPAFDQQWGLLNHGQAGGEAGADISAPDAWNISTGSVNVFIAVADTGVDYNHPDLSDNIWINAGENGTDAYGNDKRSNGIDDDLDGYTDDWNGWNFYFQTNDTMDYEGHGTHVSGIIGAVGNNHEGISGVNWHVTIMPLDISMRNGGYLSTLAAAEGFSYAKDHGATIISCSWGSYYSDPYLRNAIESNPDILFVFAAGNDANNNDANPFNPASYPVDNIISVAASDPGDNLAWFSNYGLNSVDLAAPGEMVYSTYPMDMGNYTYMSGTSMATPYVAGVAGLIKAIRPDFSPFQIKKVILQNSDVKNAFAGRIKTAGRLDAYHGLLYPDVPLSANFTATPAEGRAPLKVRFTDTSVGDPDAWNWSFGTGDISAMQNPQYTFTQAGIFTTTLVITNSTTGQSGAQSQVIRVLSDEPGINWIEATGGAAFDPRRGHAAVIYDDRMWVIGGMIGSDVWYSGDGVNWTEANGGAFSERVYHSSVVFNDRMWVIGGFAPDDPSVIKNDVWYSSNGTNWTRAIESASFSGRYGHESVVFDNRMWVIGGYNYGGMMNDVWYSEDGVNWTQATGAAPFAARMIYGLVVFDNKMWVIGGYNYGGVMSDVWYSADGVTWTQATGTAAFSPRTQHTSVVYNDRMWVIAGYDGSWYTNDVWYSEDGVNWTQATPSAEFPVRDTAASVVFDNRMWEIGGFVGGENYQLFNDVWYSPPYELPVANFTATPRQGTQSLTVQFNDTSKNWPSRWHWDFGDNSTSNEQNPRHRYSTAGTYNVSLTAVNIAGSNTTTKVRYINVTKPVPLATATPTPPAYSSLQSDESDSSGRVVRLTSLFSAQNARRGSVITLTFDQNITPEYPAAISRIQFVPDNDILELEAIVHDVRFGDIQEVPGREVAGYERVELVGVNPRLIFNGSVLFQVSGSWLAAEKAAQSDIVLMLYHNNTWEELPTRFDGEAEGSYHFIATTPEFSYLAVTIKPKENISAPVPVSTSPLSRVSGTIPPAISQAGTDGSSPALTIAVLQRIDTPVTTQSAPAPSPFQNPGIPTLVIVGIPVVIGAAGGIYLVRRWWIRRQNPALFREYD